MASQRSLAVLSLGASAARTARNRPETEASRPGRMDAMPLLAQCRHARHVVGRGHGQKIAAGEYPATRFAAAQVRRALLPLAAEVVVLA